jgi:2-keto-3-deoxy-L-rhamnonate aldolase RhmA
MTTELERPRKARMRTSKIKAKLKRNEPVLVTTLHFTDPSAYELAGLMGFDGIWMDLEHHGYSVETATGLMRAARVGSADIIFVKQGLEAMQRNFGSLGFTFDNRLS